MTPQIKQRIEQIKAGQVPDGYKRTKAGIVPVEWEEKRIGDVLTQRKTLMCISEDAPLLSFTIEEGVIDPEDKKSNKRDFLIKDMSTKKFALTEVGDIIYNPANLKFGAIHRNNLRRGVVSPIYGIFYGKQNSEFMGYLLHNQRFIDYAKIYTEGTVEKLKTLKADTFFKLKITLPSLEEQEKIVEILSTQDKLIDLQQKEIDELQKLKKILLKKMFPRKGQDVPEWRFSKVSGAWRQIKIREIANRYDNMRIPVAANLRVVGTTPYYGANGIQGYVDGFTHEGEFVLIAEDGASDLKNYPVKCVTGRIWVNNHAHVIQGKPKMTDNQFLAYYLSQADIESLLVGGGRAKLNAETLMEMTLHLPSLDEQMIVGSCIKCLDNIMELSLRKLDEMREYKKSLMQLLLTGIVRVNI